MPTDLKNASVEELERQVSDKVEQFLREELNPGEADAAASVEQLWTAIDSLMLLEIVGHLEQEFAVSLSGLELAADELRSLPYVVRRAAELIREQSR